jgi:hypothetical protein
MSKASEAYGLLLSATVETLDNGSFVPSDFAAASLMIYSLISTMTLGVPVSKQQELAEHLNVSAREWFERFTKEGN